MTTHTAEYWFLELALRDRARAFAALDEEMTAFRPLPLEAFQSQREALWNELRPLNPEKTQEDLWRFVDDQIAATASAEMQIWRRFLEPFASETVAIAMIASALCEAIINAILAIGLSAQGKQRLFSILQASDLKEKWTVAPLTMLSRYSLPKDGPLYGTLHELCKRRNALVHSKITISDGDTELVKGSVPVQMSLSPASRKLTRRFTDLPYELHAQLCEQVDDPRLRFRLEYLLRERKR
jgi:hypothetical protein